MFLKVVVVPENHRALVFQGERYKYLLKAGTHYLPYLYRLSVEIFNLDVLEIPRANLKFLVRRHPELSRLMWHAETREYEVGLIYRDDQLYDCLLPLEEKTLWLGLGDLRLSKFDVRDRPLLTETQLSYLLQKRPELAQWFELLSLGDHEVSLIYKDGRLYEILPPASEVVLWKGAEVNLRAEKIDLNNTLELSGALAQTLRFDLSAKLELRVKNLVFLAEVPERHQGLLAVNGREERWLGPGYYAFWKSRRRLGVTLVDMRLQMIDVSGQEILTRDRVSLRVNLSATFRVSNAARVIEVTTDYASHVYRALQLSLREAVGTRTLDALLENKSALNGDVRKFLGGDLDPLGIEVVDIGVKDIVLPGDMKAILNRVVEAQKEAEANLIRRREETQAMRALNNTAKMMDSSATLMRLKELEALERVTTKIDRISVYGGLEGLVGELVRLRAPPG